ncbi:hypothetical protein MMC07_004969 [Pseudocyphellaria aurata]|nr:hypothetical protein [Pseudocyphellaria aurata]
MPSKIQLDENLWFLYIDFNGVGNVTKLKPPAARMRYTRLRRAIESGTLIGTHGTPFQGGTDKTTEARRKRNKRSDDSDEESAFVTRTPIGGRLPHGSGFSKGVPDSEDTAQEGESDEMRRTKKQRRTSKLPSKAVKSEALSHDEIHFDMNRAEPSKNQCLSAERNAMERPPPFSTTPSKPQNQTFSLDAFISHSRSAHGTIDSAPREL